MWDLPKLLLMAWMCVIGFSSTTYAEYPNKTPPTFSLCIYAEAPINRFELYEILPNTADAEFVYDPPSGRKIVFSNIEFSSDTTTVSFVLSGDGVEERRYELRANQDGLQMPVAEYSVTIIMKPLTTTQ